MSIVYQDYVRIVKIRFGVKYKMDKREEAFLTDFSALLKRYKIRFYSDDQYGPDECILPTEYLFGDFEDFRVDVDEVLKYLNEERKAEERKARKKIKR